jgi:hypothetical protein
MKRQAVARADVDDGARLQTDLRAAMEHPLLRCRLAAVIAAMG